MLSQFIKCLVLQGRPCLLAQVDITNWLMFAAVRDAELVFRGKTQHPSLLEVLLAHDAILVGLIQFVILFGTYKKEVGLTCLNKG